MPTKSQTAASNKMRRIGAATCHICNERKRDCVEVKRNWFSAVVICDACGRELFRSFDPEVSGHAPDAPVDVAGN